MKKCAHEMKHGRVHRGGWFVQKITNVVASTENRFMALYHQDTDGGIGLRLIDRLRHGGVHVTRDGILFVEPIEGEGHYPGIDVGQNV
jgi:hypothetical protein